MTIQIEDPAFLPLGTGANATYQGTATTLYQVALHEFGHALGLGLSTDPSAVMNIRLGTSNTTLDASDLAGIAATLRHQGNQCDATSPRRPRVQTMSRSLAAISASTDSSTARAEPNF